MNIMCMSRRLFIAVRYVYIREIHKLFINNSHTQFDVYVVQLPSHLQQNRHNCHDRDSSRYQVESLMNCEVS